MYAEPVEITSSSLAQISIPRLLGILHRRASSVSFIPALPIQICRVIRVVASCKVLKP